MLSFAPEPSAAQHKDIRPAVVVVVGLHNIQPADFTDQSSFLRLFSETAIGIVPKITELVVQAEGRSYNVQVGISIEVLGDASARKFRNIQAERRGHIGKS